MTTGMLSQALISSIDVFADAQPTKTHVDSSEKNNSSIHNKGRDIVAVNKVGTAVTENIRSELRDLAYNLTYNEFSEGEIPQEDILPSDDNWSSLDPWQFEDTAFARVNNDMVLRDGETLAANESDLTNSSGIEQTMNTPSFTYTQTDKVTTSTTHNAGVSLTTSAEMKFPFISGSMSMNVKYDFSTTSAVESTNTKEWQVPSQGVKVPAGHKYKVTWLLNTGVATGTTDLTSYVKAIVPYKRNHETGTRYGQYIGDAIATQDRFVSDMPSTPYKWGERGNWERVDGQTALRKWGTANYKAEFGTQLIMNITDVTNVNSPVVIQQTAMNVTPITVK
ncbi:ETX/MTX2 family pore-forming toxin [Enterococcus faecalis]